MAGDIHSDWYDTNIATLYYFVYSSYCPVCYGLGFVFVDYRTTSEKCHNCKGTGILWC